MNKFLLLCGILFCLNAQAQEVFGTGPQGIDGETDLAEDYIPPNWDPGQRKAQAFKFAVRGETLDQSGIGMPANLPGFYLAYEEEWGHYRLMSFTTTLGGYYNEGKNNVDKLSAQGISYDQSINVHYDPWKFIRLQAYMGPGVGFRMQKSRATSLFNRTNGTSKEDVMSWEQNIARAKAFVGLDVVLFEEYVPFIRFEKTWDYSLNKKDLPAFAGRSKKADTLLLGMGYRFNF